MSATLRFTAPGLPQTKGSSRAFVIQRTGQKPRAIVTNDNPKAKGWQQLLAECAARALLDAQLHPFTDGAVMLDAWFYLPRPQKFLTKKYAAVDVPHTIRPDGDKLLRCAKDALTHVVWRDDSQVIDAYVHKRYCAAGEFPRAVITVRRVESSLPKPIIHPDSPLLFSEEVLYEASSR